MKKLFLFLTVIGFFVLSSCGSTENCRTRTSASNFEKSDSNTTTIAYNDLKK